MAALALFGALDEHLLRQRGATKPDYLTQKINRPPVPSCCAVSNQRAQSMPIRAMLYSSVCYFQVLGTIPQMKTDTTHVPSCGSVGPHRVVWIDNVSSVACRHGPSMIGERRCACCSRESSKPEVFQKVKELLT